MMNRIPNSAPVTTELPGYKGGVTAYNSQGTEVFSLTASDRFVMDARVMDDDTTLAVVTLGQENSVFVSNIVLYSLETAGVVEPYADYDVTDGLVAAIGEQGDRLTAVSDTSLTFATTGGDVKASYSYAGSYLREYDLGGDGFTALLLNRYKSGGVGRLVTVDTDGQEIASLDVNEEILSISAAGGYLAVLYTDSMAYLESPAYQRERGLMKQSELGATPYAGFDFTNYVSLDDGTMVGFVFGHTARYRAAEDFGYNLYRLNPDGTAVFLNAGCRRGGSELYVQDGKAHWTVNGETFSASI